MADAFPNKEQEDTDAKIDKSVKNILESVEKHWGTDTIVEEDKVLESVDKYWGTTDEKDAFSGDRKYINSLPQDYKDKVLRYLDIFRDNPEIITEYLQTLKQFGSEKNAKKAGATNVLFYPNKVLAHINKNPEKFSEETFTRWFTYINPLQGKNIYDIAYREDKEGKKIQKEYYGKTSTKIISGLGETGYDTIRSISTAIGKIVDAVGPENAKSAVEYIESNLPRADEVTYPNKTKPWDQDSAIQDIIKELSQFGVDIALGGALIKLILGPAKFLPPGKVKQITDFCN